MSKSPIYVREISNEERKRLQEGLRSNEAFVVRRSQILLASSSGKRASQIAKELQCDTDTALNAINAFNHKGVEALKAGSSVPHHIAYGFDAVASERLRVLLHQSPRIFGKATSIWTLELAAEVSYEQGLTTARVSREAVRNALQRLGVSWRRAKHWIRSPDPEYVKKSASETV